MRKVVVFLSFLLLVCAASVSAQDGPQSVDQQPSYKSGMSYIAVQVNAEMKYPAHAMSNKVEGTVLVAFTIDEDGMMHDEAVTEHVAPDLDAEALRLVALLKDWIPGKHNGKDVSMKCTVPVEFDIKKYQKLHVLRIISGSNEGLKMPTPGYDFNTYLGENTVYPEKARLKNKEGRAIVKFVVNEDGSISDVTIYKSAGNRYLDDEAIRVISNMPRWQPGMRDGVPVKVYFTQPVTFKLE